MQRAPGMEGTALRVEDKFQNGPQTAGTFRCCSFLCLASKTDHLTSKINTALITVEDKTNQVPYNVAHNKLSL